MKAPMHVHTPGWVGEFKSFILRGNVVDLAVGIVVGAAFTAIVSSLVKDIFTPIIGMLVGGIDFSNIFITLKGTSQPTLEATQKSGAVTLNIGVFLNAVIQFLIIAFAIFWVVKVINRFQRNEAPPAPPPPRSDVLLQEIRDTLVTRLPAQDRMGGS
jgi:large conductance mechanosensitive channel